MNHGRRLGKRGAVSETDRSVDQLNELARLNHENQTRRSAHHLCRMRDHPRGAPAVKRSGRQALHLKLCGANATEIAQARGGINRRAARTANWSSHEKTGRFVICTAPFRFPDGP